jgi:hypothetical protein
LDVATATLLSTEIDAATLAGGNTDARVSEFARISSRMLERAQSAPFVKELAAVRTTMTNLGQLSFNTTNIDAFVKVPNPPDNRFAVTAKAIRKTHARLKILAIELAQTGAKSGFVGYSTGAHGMFRSKPPVRKS